MMKRWLVVSMGLLALRTAHAQVFVYPRRPAKSNVQYYGFKWRYIDLVVGEGADTADADRVREGLDATPAPGQTGAVAEAGAARAGEETRDLKRTQASKHPPSKQGGIRLFFYESEREIAERAAVAIEQTYNELVQVFGYQPQITFPYVLYSSYQEFRRTNLFPVQEGVLGVTSPQSLELTLPYFGDHSEFLRVSRHELAHEFTIQKIRSIAREKKTWGNPLESLPQWFVEGSAEYIAQRGIDPEADMRARDLVVNPWPAHAHYLGDFFSNSPYNTLWIYKLGQVRCAFLDDVYGQGTVQRIISNAYKMALPLGRRLNGFTELVQSVTGDKPEEVSAKFAHWIKARVFAEWLDNEQDLPQLKPLPVHRGAANAIAAAPSGNLLAVRSTDPQTGRTSLYLVDPRAPDHDRLVVADARPGVESLHPIDPRNFDLRDDRIVYAAEFQGHDVLYWERIDHAASRMAPKKHGSGPDKSAGPPSENAALPPEPTWKVRLRVGHRKAYRFDREHIVAIYSPVFSPAGDQVAFIGLDTKGTRDLYVMTPQGRHGYSLTQVTHDPYAERQVAWGPQGLIYTSDVTGSGRHNLFQVAPDGSSPPIRLTVEDRDELDPVVLADGRVLFTAWDGAAANLYEVKGPSPGGIRQVVQRTDISTGLFNASPGPDGSLWTLFYFSGRYWPARLPAAQLLQRPAVTEEAPEPPRIYETRPLDDAKVYHGIAPRNWQVEPGFGYVGAGAGALYGQVYLPITDRLRNQSLVMNMAAWGNFQLLEGYAFYSNRLRRWTWGTGPFQQLRFRVDDTFFDQGLRFTSYERYVGMMSSLRYPFGRFVYVQADLTGGIVDPFLSYDIESFLSDGSSSGNGTGQDLLKQWNADHPGIALQSELTGRIGFDSIRYHPKTGPLAGQSALLEGMLGVRGRGSGIDSGLYGTARIDAEKSFPLISTAKVYFRGGFGTSFGGDAASYFFLYSYETLRGAPFGDTDFLLGRHYLYTTGEFQFPLDPVIRLALISNIQGVAGLDFGTVSDSLDRFWNRRILDLALGGNFILGPLELRIQWAKPFDIGAPVPNDGAWVPNISLGWLYM